MDFSHHASMTILGKGQAPKVAMGLVIRLSFRSRIVTWAGPPAGTCGGGLARGLYETILPIELASMLGAARPNSFA